jgi:hypothetical protein
MNTSRNFVLLMGAYLVTLFGFIPLLVTQSFLNRDSLGRLYLNIAISLDHLWCKLVFGVTGHTVSAYVYKLSLEDKKYLKYVKAINLIFQDELHCKNAYQQEFRR